MNKGYFFPAGRTMNGAGLGMQLTLNNCFQLGSVPDSMNEIFDTVRIGAITQKTGGGTGYDFSSLRPNDTPTANDAKASGPVSFMSVFNQATATIVSSGRRGANMGVLSIYHPDIEEFIDLKADPNNPTNMQFFNVSVMVDDDFMNAVANDEAIYLHYPVYTEDFQIERDPSKWTHKRCVSARALWDKIMKSAYSNAGDPGVLFYDNMNKDNNTWYCETIIGTNPCGEYVSGTLRPSAGLDMGEDVGSYKGACNLGSLFLPSFLDIDVESGKGVSVRWHVLEATVHTAVKMLDKIIDKNYYPHEDFENYQKNLRTIGLGITGLADMMALLGMPYGSSESVLFADALMEYIAFTAYSASMELAKEQGAFPFCDKEKLHESYFLQKHLNDRFSVSAKYKHRRKLKEQFREQLNERAQAILPPDVDWGILMYDMRLYGLRNARLLSVAPTGTLSLVYGNNCSSGLEPIFALEQVREVKIGGQNDEDKQTVTLNNPAWEKYQQCKEQGIDLPGVDDSCFVTALELPVQKHLDVLAAIAYHVDMSCSKTINIPQEYSFEDTKEVYTWAWKHGIKGCTIFRPNEYRKGVFVTDGKSSAEDTEEPESLAHEDDDLPRGYVIQVTDNVIGRERHLRTGCGTLHIQAYFDPTTGDLLEAYASRGSMGGCNSFMTGMSRQVSLAARGGISVEDIVDQLRSAPPCIAYNNRSRDYKDTSKGTSCPSAMGNAILDMYEQVQRDLGKTTNVQSKTDNKDDTDIKEKVIAAIQDVDALLLAENKCPDCGEPLTFEGGCNVCKSCGWSKCG